MKITNRFQLTQEEIDKVNALAKKKQLELDKAVECVKALGSQREIFYKAQNELHDYQDNLINNKPFELKVGDAIHVVKFSLAGFPILSRDYGIVGICFAAAAAADAEGTLRFQNLVVHKILKSGRLSARREYLEDLTNATKIDRLFKLVQEDKKK